MTSTRTHETEIIVDPDVPLVRIIREFDAPPEKVFRAHTDPELIVQWLGPRDLTMTVDHFDCRTGGSYRYVHTRDGEEYGFNGCFHEVRPGELIVQTFTFEGFPDGVALETARLRGPRGRPHPARRDVTRRLVRGPRRLRRERHGDRGQRGLREARRAARRLSARPGAAAAPLAAARCGVLGARRWTPSRRPPRVARARELGIAPRPTDCGMRDRPAEAARLARQSPPRPGRRGAVLSSPSGEAAGDAARSPPGATARPNEPEQAWTSARRLGTVASAARHSSQRR